MASGATVTGEVGLSQPARASAPRASSRLLCDMVVSIVGAPSCAPGSATVTRSNLGRRGQGPSNGRALGVNHLKRRQLGMRRSLVVLLVVAAGGPPFAGEIGHNDRRVADEPDDLALEEPALVVLVDAPRVEAALRDRRDDRVGAGSLELLVPDLDDDEALARGHVR